MHCYCCRFLCHFPKYVCQSISYNVCRGGRFWRQRRRKGPGATVIFDEHFMLCRMAQEVHSPPIGHWRRHVSAWWGSSLLAFFEHFSLLFLNCQPNETNNVWAMGFLPWRGFPMMSIEVLMVWLWLATSFLYKVWIRCKVLSITSIKVKVTYCDIKWTNSLCPTQHQSF